MGKVWVLVKDGLTREIPTLGEANQMLTQGWTVQSTPAETGGYRPVINQADKTKKEDK